jgi:hypothetical protein
MSRRFRRVQDSQIHRSRDLSRCKVQPGGGFPDQESPHTVQLVGLWLFSLIRTAESAELPVDLTEHKCQPPSRPTGPRVDSAASMRAASDRRFR